MSYIRKNNKVEYVGIEPTDISELCSVLSSLFLDLGFQKELIDGHSFLFSKKVQGLFVCLTIRENSLVISMPTKNQIMTSLKFPTRSLRSFHLEVIVDCFNTDKKIYVIGTSLSVCNVVLSYIRLLWFSGNKDVNDYLKDITMFVENTNKGVMVD
jgi:hypothetical protein